MPGFKQKEVKRENMTKSSSGFTLIEMIVYTAILSIVFVIVVNTLLVLSRSYRSIKLTNDINNSASLALERLTRDIRSAESVNTSSSVIGSSPGELVLNATIDGSSTTLDFYVNNGALMLDVGGVLLGSLTRDNIEVTNLVFRHRMGTNGETVKIEMTLRGTEKNVIKEENFYSTVVLRGSY